jgi:hypothetical protein
MIPQNPGPEGRDCDESEEERDEEDFRRLMVEEAVTDRDSEVGEGNYLALTTVKNANVENNVPVVECPVNTKEGVSQPKEIELSNNANAHSGGLQNSSNTDCSCVGGVVRNLTMSDVVGQQAMYGGTGAKRQAGGVYSDGPRSVYLKLNKDDSGSKVGKKLHSPSKQKPNRVHPLPASVRKQQHIIQQLKLKIPSSELPSYVSCSIPLEQEVSSRRSDADALGVCRNSPSRHRKGAKSSNSLSSAGTVLCCSSLSSSDIRNCNRRAAENHDLITAQKVWKGAVDLGVEGEDTEEGYIARILVNKNQEEVAKRLREQHKDGKP